jgi:hypothetical protein
VSERDREIAEKGRVDAENKRASHRHFYAKMAATFALPLAFIALIPALIGIWMVDNETDARISANRAHIAGIDAVAARGAEAHEALCIFRDDLSRRIDASEQFIDEIKQGLRAPFPSITTAELERSLASQKATLSALSDLKCRTPN